ncbi:ATP-dependent RNA helicase dbp6 [Drechslerella dactyloides]|uniref:ATP-dependent RNA helicase n=1 Tax=Drechslerella dactyloides TaxID=74499 RepID=A0AAD6J786_DREDA|nr:ATP-dependent RNA helicase dbp6 [Drechslerella dactyloides]
MSKKRKRDTDAAAAEQAVNTSVDAAPSTHDHPKKKESRIQNEKAKKQRQSPKQGSLSDSPQGTADIHAPPANISASSLIRNDSGEDSSGSDDVARRHAKHTDKGNIGKHTSVDGNDTKDGKKTAQKVSKDGEHSTGHLSILSKFDKYRTEVLGDAPKEPTIETETATEQLQGLHPLPLPLQAPIQRVDPNSVLPAYLSQPTTIPTTQKPPFGSFNLSTRLLSRLKDLNITHTFPVQSALLPLLLPAENQSFSIPRADLLVSAATGSGKTLSYLLPIISSLQNRSIPRTYALIIVPTHELAAQVQKTAQFLSSGTSLKIGTAVGARSFDVEKEYISNDIGSTGADILIATPGRLVEHIRKNPHFTLRYLQWLIIDEADRLLSQSFQDWVGIVGDELQKPFDAQAMPKKCDFDIISLGLRPPKCAADSVRKVVLSATMTRDVGKLAGLRLRRPRLIAVGDAGSREILTSAADSVDGKDEDKLADTGLRELNSLPSTLEEHFYAISNPSHKPLVLSRLLLANDITRGILVFTKSNESAARLGRLLDLILSSTRKHKKSRKETQRWAIAVSTSDKRKREISANTAKFKSSTIDILISTDLLARGVDLPNAQLVVNYDSPRSEKDYIHRVGRTARAGNRGVAWSLVEDSEAKWWWAEIGKIRRGNLEGIKKERAPTMDAADIERYEGALEILGREVRGQ